MSGCLPWIAIVVVALAGGAIGGVLGFIVGGVVGYVGMVGLGVLGVKVSGGLLPRRERRDTALSFYDYDREFIESHIPPPWRGRSIAYIEFLLEKIVKRAALVGPSSSSGLTWWEVAAAYEIESQNAYSAQERELLERLWRFLQKEWYGGVSKASDVCKSSFSRVHSEYSDEVQEFYRVNHRYVDRHLISEWKDRPVAYLEHLFGRIMQSTSIVGPASAKGLTDSKLVGAVEIEIDRATSHYEKEMINRIGEFLRKKWFT
ncbi:MAG: hypothetical protein AB1644_05795 [Candidatus Zixiibacteriota bacterium]